MSGPATILALADALLARLGSGRLMRAASAFVARLA